MQLSQGDYHSLADLVSLAREINRQGHNSATSGNYSLKASNDVYWVSQSGVDKGALTLSHFLPVNDAGKLLEEPLEKNVKTSDEMAVHLAIYRQMKNAGCVIHAHSMAAIVWSEERLQQKRPLVLKGWELLKGLHGIKTHEIAVDIAHLDNSQDMDALAKQIVPKLSGANQWCLILRGHGIYVWGGNVAEAKRHWETYQYLFELENRLSLHANR